MTRARNAYADQRFLLSADAAEKMALAAGVGPEDSVFEAGTGTGALVRHLCARAARVTSVERDEELYEAARASLGRIPNLSLRCGDAFLMEEDSDVFVSSLPYSQSRRAFEWMAQRSFARGAVLVQKEFAEKLLTGRPADRRAISVIARAAFEIRRVCAVDRRSFDRPPRVDSVILSLRRRRSLDAQTIRAVGAMFSYRRKTLRGILARLGSEAAAAGGARLEELDTDEIVRIARELGS